MGRLTNFGLVNLIDCTGTTERIYTGSGITLNTFDQNTNNIISGTTISDIHIFVDESGNVTQIKKINKTRTKYCIDPELERDLISYCVIGVSDEDWGECSNGIGMGVGDLGDPVIETAYAKYDLLTL